MHEDTADSTVTVTFVSEYKSQSGVDREKLLTWLLPVVFLSLAVLTHVDGKFSYINWWDNAHYLLLAKAVATGAGYADSFMPGSPAHTRYPPLFPVLLSPLFRLFGYNFYMMRLLVALFAVLSLFFIKGLFERISDRRTAVAVALLTGTNYFFLFISDELLTEAPYMFFAFLALWLWERFSAGQLRVPYVLALSAAVSLAYMTRYVGVALYLAFLCLFIHSRRRGKRASQELPLRGVVLFGVAAAAPLLLWLIRCVLAGGGGGSYLSIFTMEDFYAEDRGRGGVLTLLFRASGNVSLYGKEMVKTILSYPYARMHISGTVVAVLAVVLTLLVIAGLLHELRSRRTLSAGALYFAVYSVVVLFWPVRGTGDATRYMVPLLPFIYYYMFSGAFSIASLLGGRKSRNVDSGKLISHPIVLGLALLLLMNNLMISKHRFSPSPFIRRLSVSVQRASSLLLRPVEEVRLEDFAVGFFDAFSPPYAEYLRGADFIRRVSSPGDVIVARKPEITALVSGRLAVGFPFTTNSGRIDDFLEKSSADYVLVDGWFVETARYLIPYIKGSPGRFTPLEDGLDHIAVFKVGK